MPAAAQPAHLCVSLKDQFGETKAVRFDEGCLYLRDARADSAEPARHIYPRRVPSRALLEVAGLGDGSRTHGGAA
ncbi:hypothetical protein XAP412_330025 [Xanthomonas phaseoli pv. phaseoli]|uniref:Uncharacterized protein n=1 Tax=Xanthomonas campestris pv. phaseoli TaxID=317013 RepID=A0AB38DZP0_XANCH|nr:hypothetical protein XAP6984_390025 [Xanthomonas phaseoli pv. phaseoli]SON84276.1 hypothetical protein XAP412_330025 [Xanthomonas phaseoli pv. phaseoli]SON88659.1 hypothetical protein XAP7430_380025 [Xanthomonas phaseoli pv. phaseoli]SOO27521.1 hypothetical protein XAP6164_1690008 [Xanthomonas phaseoli pv. phaseoli]